MNTEAMNIFVVVVTTFRPVFMKINELRRQQCKKYNIPILFVYNGNIPEGYVLKPDERCFPMDNHAPAMFLKFKYAIQEIYNAHNVNPDYIVRINSRTYVNFENLKYFMSYVGKDKVAAGPFLFNENKIYMLGTCMIFSKDVAQRFAAEDNVKGPVLWHSDDCTISWAIKDYANFYDMTTFNENVAMCSKKVMPTELPPFSDKTVIFRIKSGVDGGLPYGTPLSPEEEIDIQYWKLLLKKYDDIVV
jgi:hypothetical protein